MILIPKAGVAADVYAVDMLVTQVEQSIKREQMPEEAEQRYLEFIKEELAPRYAEWAEAAKKYEMAATPKAVAR